MECLTTSFTRNAGREYNFTCPRKLVSEKQWSTRRSRCYFSAPTNSSQCHKFNTMAYARRPPASDADGIADADPSENQLSRRLTSNELKALLADSERTKLLRRLSEANQYNRFLKRQLQIKDDAVVKFKSELAVLDLELQALVGLAEEIANFDVPSGSRKISGKYIQSHLLSRLEAVHDKVIEQIKDVDSLKPREVSVYWVGMAEDVQIMGSFDGWSQGESMSMEYSGDYARFSTTLKLRPGRYEIKFLVDGDWRLSPEYPIAGEGMTQNNILVVE
ncbi:hypothetical protein QOZ80_2BG0154410 [Eleusine coracana subsp. coracana]|nr:hypothetical protein QOZ80_2BG0154410 [Eleusine coracana subsp. coracana]